MVRTHTPVSVFAPDAPLTYYKIQDMAYISGSENFGKEEDPPLASSSTLRLGINLCYGMKVEDMVRTHTPVSVFAPDAPSVLLCFKSYATTFLVLDLRLVFVVFGCNTLTGRLCAFFAYLPLNFALWPSSALRLLSGE